MCGRISKTKRDVRERLLAGGIHGRVMAYLVSFVSRLEKECTPLHTLVALHNIARLPAKARTTPRGTDAHAPRLAPDTLVPAMAQEKHEG